VLTGIEFVLNNALKEGWEYATLCFTKH